jgi:hypothetical protein
MITANQMNCEQKQTIQLELDKIVSAFFDATAMANFEANLIADTFLKVYAEEEHVFEQFKRLAGGIPSRFKGVNLHAIDLRSEEKTHILISGAFCHGEGFLGTLKWNFNNQICWQLVNIYELFEVFIKDLYAVIGYFDNKFWKSSDYGKLQPNEVGDLDLSGYKQAAKKNLKTKGAGEILNGLRRNMPILKMIEIENTMKSNLAVNILIIEQMRHQIVHKRGNASLGKFIDRVNKKSNIAIHAKSAEYIKAEIESYFVNSDCEEGYKLLLADLATVNGRGSGFLLKSFSSFIETIVSYAVTISELAALHLEVVPIRKRWCNDEFRMEIL